MVRRERRFATVNTRTEVATHRQAIVDAYMAGNGELIEECVARCAQDVELYAVRLPQKMSLLADYDGVMKLINDIRILVLVLRKNIAIDMSALTEIGPAAALLLTAEIHRCMRISGDGGHVRQVIPPADASVYDHLNKIGFFHMLDIEVYGGGAITAPLNDDVEYIRYMSRNRVAPSLVQELRQQITRDIPEVDEIARQLMFSSIKEAMINATEHAYPRDDAPLFPYLRNRWWLSGAFDHKTRTINVVILDQGIGIPRSLPRRYSDMLTSLWEDWRLNPNDARMIAMAMVIGRTSSDDRGRGRGLKDIRGFVERTKKGWLRIMSGRGELAFTPSGGEILRDLPTSLGGTLVQWSVPAAVFGEPR